MLTAGHFITVGASGHTAEYYYCARRAKAAFLSFSSDFLHRKLTLDHSFFQQSQCSAFYISEGTIKQL